VIESIVLVSSDNLQESFAPISPNCLKP